MSDSTSTEEQVPVHRPWQEHQLTQVMKATRFKAIELEVHPQAPLLNCKHDAAMTSLHYMAEVSFMHDGITYSVTPWELMGKVAMTGKTEEF